MEKAKTKLTLTKDRIAKFMTNSLKTGKEKRSAEFLSTRLQLLDKYWTQFQEAYEEHYELAAAELLTSTAEEVDKELDEFSDTECAYIDAVQWLKEQLSALNPTHDSVEHELLQSTMQPRSQAASLKLPKINLPSFNGAYLDWPSFRDTYVSLIHQNESLADVQKLHYLKSAVTGDASKLLHHFSITNNNYSSAWKTLVDRYANTRVLVNVNLQSLVNLQPMSSESPLELQRVVDTFKQSVRALENLDRPVDHWNDWLTYFLANKLEPTTRKDWETSLSSSTEVPTFTCLTEFLERRLQALSAIKHTHTSERKSFAAPKQNYPRSISRIHLSSTGHPKCALCHEKHILLFCPQFKAMTIDNRIDLLQRKRICSNCLNPAHTLASCPSIKRCKICNQKHHTMTHRPVPVSDTTSSNAFTPLTPVNDQTSSTRVHLTNYSRGATPVLLATAVLLIESKDGRTLKVRALLDQGSESSFITSALANLLNLPKQHTHISVLGANECELGIVNNVVYHDIISLHTEHRYSIQSLVLPTLSKFMPSQQITQQDWPHLLGLPLADPEYDHPAPIDLILGVDVYARILLEGVRLGPPGTPTAQLTTLGWILSGPINSSVSPPSCTLSLHASTSEICTLLKRFWESEEPPTSLILTPDEEYCDEFFQQTHTRDSTGRYVVRLPMKSPAKSLGSSRDAAMSCLLRMENKLARDPQLNTLYKTFMNEYLQLRHMEEVMDESTDHPTYYLPHHGVLKPSSSTTKLRVVFNASLKTSSHVSLNDILHTGPKLQNDVTAVIMKWRLYPYVLTGDMEKMYRQIWVNKDDIDLQRRTTEEPVKCYRLCTVTYGTACAPYLACKTLRQLAEKYSTTHPLAAKTIKDNLYVDDALFGAYDEEEARHLRHELCALLANGGFKLRKWQANAASLLQDIPEEDRALPDSLKVVNDATIKTLGIEWSPSTDVFSFPIILPNSSSATKRTILADISRLYDPLGWLSPVTITAKIFLQQLWLAKLDWDDPLPFELNHTWNTYKRELQGLSEVRINRWIGTTLPSLGLELHGFSDASLSAYGATVYLKVIRNPDNCQVSLVAAKTRVSPLKTISLPRLELCGAALLAELVLNIQSTLDLKEIPVHLWTDSTIVLAWLKEHPSKWKVFVANRVSLIHQKIPNAIWHHVQSAQNPADCLTRGLSPSELISHNLWWSGPQWLRHDSAGWPTRQEQHYDDTAHNELQKGIEKIHTFRLLLTISWFVG